MIKRRNLWLVFLLTILVASSCGVKSPYLVVEDAWARTALNGQNSAVYFVIKNNTSSDDVFMSATTDIAEAAEAHMSMQNDQGVVSMHPMETVPVPTGQDVAFKPGNLHIMLVNLNRDLKVNDVFTLKLRFQNAGEIKLQVEVKEQ